MLFLGLRRLRIVVFRGNLQSLGRGLGCEEWEKTWRRIDIPSINLVCHQIKIKRIKSPFFTVRDGSDRWWRDDCLETDFTQEIREINYREQNFTDLPIPELLPKTTTGKTTIPPSVRVMKNRNGGCTLSWSQERDGKRLQTNQILVKTLIRSCISYCLSGIYPILLRQIPRSGRNHYEWWQDKTDREERSGIFIPQSNVREIYPIQGKEDGDVK